ncbi:MAG TPA: transporter substrate-binding domain-containing protein [Burkholderiaceae bacterium]|jgi:polar amino acid transport system substrate-binding protein
MTAKLIAIFDPPFLIGFARRVGFFVAAGFLFLALPVPGRADTLPALKIGAEDDWYPFSGQRGGHPVGMVPELVLAAFAAEGVQVELVSLPYSRCMKMTESNLLLGCFDTLRNPLLEKKFRWAAHPLLRARIDIYARSDAPDRPVHISDLHGKKIGVTNGYEYGAPFDGDSTMQRDIGDSDLFAMRKLVAGRVDYALVYTRIASAAMRDHAELRGKIKSVGTLIEPEIFLSFAPNYPMAEKYIALFDAGMAQIVKNGMYARIEARWR